MFFCVYNTVCWLFSSCQLSLTVLCCEDTKGAGGWIRQTWYKPQCRSSQSNKDAVRIQMPLPTSHCFLLLIIALHYDLSLFLYLSSHTWLSSVHAKGLLVIPHILFYPDTLHSLLLWALCSYIIRVGMFYCLDVCVVGLCNLCIHSVILDTGHST